MRSLVRESPTLPLLFCINGQIILRAIDDLIPERSLEESNTLEELRRRERELADFIECLRRPALGRGRRNDPVTE